MLKKTIMAFLPIILLGIFAVAQPRFALLIGNGAYQKGAPLRNPVNDAILLGNTLSKCGFNTMVRSDLGFLEFKHVVDSFFNRIRNTKSDVFFFYSGHGIQHNNENYLIPVDADLGSPSDLDDQCIKVQFLLDKLEDAGTHTNIIVMDACRNDPFSKSWTRDGLGVPGLAQINLSQSFISYATAPNKRASDGKGTNSPFSASLAKFILEPGIPIYEVFQKVTGAVHKQNPEQTPWNSSSLESNFYFLPAGEKQNGPTPMHFLISEDCFLYINGEFKNELTGGRELSLEGYPSGEYKIRAVSRHDSTMYYDTTFHYDPGATNADNFLYIPLNNRILQISAQIRPILDSIRFNMIRVDGGTFDMGSNGGDNTESPVHRVTVHPFWIGKYEVTQRQWSAIMGTMPETSFDCPECPVENINWIQATDFINTLNFMTGEHYRLPTEAEWEFAASGGNLSNKYLFSGGKKLDKLAWYQANSHGRPNPVGKRISNELGIADMSGNVAEWCADWYEARYYNHAEMENPQGPPAGKERVIRGGSWYDFDKPCMIFSRDKKEIHFKSNMVGFRLAK